MSERTYADLSNSRILMGPGPSNIHFRVMQALARPTLGHMDPAYFRIMDETQALLRETFLTRNVLTLALPVTGMGAMEASLVNLLEPGDAAIVCVNGVFSGRIAEIAERLGAQVRRIATPWGRATPVEEIERALKAAPAKLVALVHGETSTGVLQTHVPGIARACHAAGALLLVDTVASLGGAEFKTDAWEVDAVYTGSQKCLSVPPGISPLTFGPRAEEALARRKQKVASWYMDLTLVRKYWNEERVYHHTGPVNMTYALLEGLRLIKEEGLEARIARHAKMARALYAGLEAMGLQLYVANPAERLPTVTTVRVPEGADDAKARKALLERHGLEIGGGLGEWKGKAWRVGLMGEGACPNHVLLFLSALGGALKAQGVAGLKPGAGVEAAAEAMHAN